jgi:hypothetical protein
MINQIWQRGKKRHLAQVCPYGKDRVTRLIRQGHWREGLHFVTDLSGDRIYNLTLIEDWMANMNDQATHQRACELYLASLPSSKSKTPKNRTAA